MSRELPDDVLKETIEAIRLHGDTAAAAVALKMRRSTVAARVRTIRQRFPHDLPEANDARGWAFQWAVMRERTLAIRNGTVLCGGDLHRWPGPHSMCWQAFAAVAQELRPDYIILNGDMIDGARVSRHARIPGQRTPKVTEEVSALKDALDMLPSCKKAWTWGNHDYRVNGYLAANAPELEDYTGTLQDRFAEWPVSWAVVINDSVEIRHRFKGGIHAAYNNAKDSGRTTITNHTHQNKCTPINDRNGRRWGVETGCLADPAHPAFEYGEGAPSRSAPGFVWLTFADGELRPPELAEPADGRIWFRGRSWAGKPRVRVKAGRAA